MMYVVKLFAYLIVWAVAMVLAPILPAFARERIGPSDNARHHGVEPRLPVWLGWFDTSTDNSLWGDNGWRTEHCPIAWRSYRGMVLWLWRNPACGFSWSVVAHKVFEADVFSLDSSGCGLDLDKSRPGQGWFLITSDAGAFQYRQVNNLLGLQFSFEAGWLLDVYLKDRQAIHDRPKAIFMFQPSVRRIRP